MLSSLSCSPLRKRRRKQMRPDIEQQAGQLEIMAGRRRRTPPERTRIGGAGGGGECRVNFIERMSAEEYSASDDDAADWRHPSGIGGTHNQKEEETFQNQKDVPDVPDKSADAVHQWLPNKIGNGQRASMEGKWQENRGGGGGIGRLWERLKAQLAWRDKFNLAPGQEGERGEEGKKVLQRPEERKKADKKMAKMPLAASLATIDEEDVEINAGKKIHGDGASSGINEEEFVIFCVRIHLREGHGLAVRDASGSSDPYAKCQYGRQTLYRSETVFRELNPNWDEEFAFLVEDPTQELTFKVFDYDRFMKDDFMGAANIALSTVALFQKMDYKLPLADPEGECPEPYLGYLLVSVTLTPLTRPQKEMFMGRAVRGIVSEQSGRRTNKTSTAILSRVTILLVAANLSIPSSANISGQIAPDTHVKFKLGNEKFKSKTFVRSSSPKWLEQFELHVFDENFQRLDVSVCDSRLSSILGKCSIDLTDFKPGHTVEKWHHLEEKAGAVHLLLTISPSTSTGWEQQGIVLEGERAAADRQIASRYNFWSSFHSIPDIGSLIVKVYEAEGLAAADLNGKSDPFCVLELVNLRAQTQTEYKTLSPKWDRTFTFFVKDVHEALELTVYDEDPNKRAEFLGKIAIPLFKIRNGEKRWYGMKNRKLSGTAKGRILVEATLNFNYFKAALRTFKPRERKLVQPVERFKRSKFLANINRLRSIGDQIMALVNFGQSCLSWHSYPKSICALTAYVIFVTFVQLWHFPLILLLIFLRSYWLKRLNEHFQNWTNRRKKRSLLTMADGSVSLNGHNLSVDELMEWENEGAGEEANTIRVEEEGEAEELMGNEQIGGKWKANGAAAGEESSKSLKGRIQAIQDILVLIQTKSDFLLGLVDRVRNVFNFTVPFLSFLAIIVLILATILLYVVPLRWILIIWGINKFSKKLRNPNYVDNNELLDFLSRIPTDKEICDFRNSSRLLSASFHSNQMTAINTNTNGNGASSQFANGKVTMRKK